MTPMSKPEGTIPGVRPEVFGWQQGEEITHYDDQGNRISAEAWLEKLRKKHGVKKDYNPNEARDRIGRWTSGGRVLGASPKSPNTPELPDLGAVSNYRKSPRYQQFKSFVAKEAKQRNLRVQSSDEAAGVYEGTVEPSLAIRVRDGDTDMDDFANSLGERYKQESILDFQLAEDGDDAYYTLHGIGDSQKALDAMDKHGIEGGSIIGDRLETADFGGSAEGAIMALAKELGATPTFVRGTATFHEKGKDYLKNG